MTERVKIGIVGAGAIGGVIATMLAKANYDVEITKPNYGGVVIDNRINIEINGVFGNVNYLVPFVEGNAFTTPKDILIVCTKAYSVYDAINDTKKYLKNDGVVVCVQNVLSLNDVFRVIPPEKFIPLVIDWSSMRQNQNDILVFNNGVMHIGFLNGGNLNQLKLVKSVLDNVCNTVIEKDVYGFLFGRFLLYCNTSCLGALTGYKLGVYLKEKQAKKILLELISEQLTILQKMNIKPQPYCNILDYYKFTEKSLQGIFYRRDMFKRLIEKNGENVSQTLRLIENKHKSEVDYLCNYFSKMAIKFNVYAPYNNAMTKLLKQIETGQKSIVLKNLYDEEFLNIKE